tara:strand:- start:6736 stop:8040 length:1305 start_codon:yes stop_codon:yes gene_type:complete
MNNPTPRDLHNQVTKTHGNKFCAAPWNSLHEGPDGLVSTCCKTREPIGWSHKQTFEEMYNSEHIKTVRSQFLKGEQPAQCIECWRQEESGNPSSNRVMSNSSGFQTIDELVRATDSDGTLNKHMPEWLDLLWTNKCNFACLGCSPEISSTINNKHKKSFAILNGVDIDHYHKESINWNNANKNKIDYIIKYSDTIKTIHLNGGEPFMQEGVYELLEEMIKRNLHKKIRVWSHTNGSIIKGYKGIDLISDYLVHWGDNAKITLSNDGFGIRGEYIRYGYNESKWLQVFDKIVNSNIRLNVQTCINVMNASVIGEVGERLYELGNRKKVDGSVTMWMNPTLNTRMLNIVPELKQQVLTNMYNAANSKNLLPNWHKTLNNAIEWTKNNEIIPDWKTRALYRGINELDRTRNTNFCNVFPELTILYNKLKDKHNAESY